MPKRKACRKPKPSKYVTRYLILRLIPKDEDKHRTFFEEGLRRVMLKIGRHLDGDKIMLVHSEDEEGHPQFVFKIKAPADIEETVLVLAPPNPASTYMEHPLEDAEKGELVDTKFLMVFCLKDADAYFEEALAERDMQVYSWDCWTKKSRRK